MFVQRIGPNGEPEWVVVDEEGGDDGSVADVLRSSAYLNMLHDRPRAAAYARALEVVLEQKKREGGKKSLLVLEIGAGSGLLSILAARGNSSDGGDDAVSVSVVACEQFPPMARLARRVVEDNGLDEEKVRVFCCRSEDLEVDDEEKGRGRQQQEGKEFLLPARADVVVSEILDSVLVGEGVLPVMRDVSRRGLMREDAVAIPSRGRVLVQAVRSRALGLSAGGFAAAVVGGGFDGDGERRGGWKKQRHQRCCTGGGGNGSRCPVPLHLDPLYLSEELVPLGDPLVLFDLDLARPRAAKKDLRGESNGNESGSGDGVVETSTVELFPEADEDEGDSPFAFDALALWWEVDLAPGASLSTAPCWATRSSSSRGEKEEETAADWTDHWRSCWVPVPLCRRQRGQKGRPFVVRGVLRDTEISVEVLPPPEEEEEELEEETPEEKEQESSSSSCCRFCSVPQLYSPSGDWGWGTARGSPAALLLEQGAKAAAARARAAATAAAAGKEEGGGDGAATVLVVGDGHGAAKAAAAAAASAASGSDGIDLRVLALQPSRAGCLAVERLAAAPPSSAGAAGRAAVVEVRLLSDFVSPSPSSSSVPRPPPAVALLAEPHYRAAEGSNLPWRLLDFWPRRDELVERARLLPLPLSSASPGPSLSSVTSPAKVFVVVAAISCPLLSRNYNGALKEVEGVSMRVVDEAFRKGIGEEGKDDEDGKKERGARALFAAPLWQVRAKEISPRAVLFLQRIQLDVSTRRASEALPASDEVELDVFSGGEEGEIVHGVACWLRFEAAASSEDPAATVAADLFAPDPSGAPCPGSQAILLFHEPWKKKKANKKTLRVRVTLSLDEEGKKVDGKVVAFC